jgi:hypothetical protein
MAWDRPHHRSWGWCGAVIVHAIAIVWACSLLLLGGWFRGGCLPLCMGIVWGVGRGHLEFIGMGGHFGWSWHVGGGSLRAVIAICRGPVLFDALQIPAGMLQFHRIPLDCRGIDAFLQE